MSRVCKTNVASTETQTQQSSARDQTLPIGMTRRSSRQPACHARSICTRVITISPSPLTIVRSVLLARYFTVVFRSTETDRRPRAVSPRGKCETFASLLLKKKTRTNMFLHVLFGAPRNNCARGAVFTGTARRRPVHDSTRVEPDSVRVFSFGDTVLRVSQDDI